MSIVIFGGDGYLGWPLAVKLALRHPDRPVVIADNGARRRHVAEVGGRSVIPIAPLDERLAAFRRTFDQANLTGVTLDVHRPEVEAFIAQHRPTTVYHLAQQASAPYSMSDVERAAYTISNNEIGNIRILFALRSHAPQAHLVKLGSFGEYAKCGLDIAEGYFRPTYRGREAERPVPYPRASDDIYHVTKINDSNFIGMACRKWGLRVTDVMQSTIFGVSTPEIEEHPALYTRFDQDAVFGTVMNRFITQTVAGHPMTVYGTGLQRTGLMGLDDSLSSLAAMCDDSPAAGEHRVINHVTEQGWCILEIAQTIRAIAAERGMDARILTGAHDPRCEQDAQKMAYDIDADHVAANLRPTPVREILAATFDRVSRHRDRIEPSLFPPQVRW